MERRQRNESFFFFGVRKKLETEGLTSYRSAENGGREVGFGCAEERGEDRGKGRRRT